MKDRISQFPGRVKLTPVAGEPNTFDLVRADQPTQDGTPINKASLLKDTTAALYGLPNTAVPDDVLSSMRLRGASNPDKSTAAKAGAFYIQEGTPAIIWLCYGQDSENNYIWKPVGKAGKKLEGLHWSGEKAI